MSENHSPGQQPPSDPNPSSQSSKDLANELRELGTQLEQTFRTMIQSDQAKAIKDNLTVGLQEIGKQVQAGLKSLQENPKVQQFADRGQQAVSQAQQSQAFKEFQETLVTGIGQLNAKLEEFVTRLENRPPTSPGSTTPSQQVPVEDATQPPTTPATGETQRLDM